MTKYYCWGEDKEDLTEQVRAAISSTAEVTAFVNVSRAAPKKKLKKWRVCVQCAKGHENIFEGETPSLSEGDFNAVLKKKTQYER